ncbi:MAG: agmatine deiminase family protein [Sandaracinaceae bacterium]|nr:agmatine deiminase family protein [Sandaracinaceae bacterium]
MLSTKSLRLPAEWEAHESVWVAWPSDRKLWGEDGIEKVRQEFEALVRAISSCKSNQNPHAERIELLCRTEEDEIEVKKRFSCFDLRIHRLPYGDIWCRDTLPVVLVGEKGERASLLFRFNGWGEKYDLPGDREVGQKVAQRLGFPIIECALTLEGGAIESDGQGTILTTRNCLLHPKRNPGLSEKEIEKTLLENLGASKVIWLEGCLANDHTDGHIDTIVRFVAPGVVVCMEARSSEDPNRETLRSILTQLKGVRDAQGRVLEVWTIPSPGHIRGIDGSTLPASYVNFYISNCHLIVPTYGSPWDEEAVQTMQRLCTHRKVVGLSAISILEGGGAFHCITQPVPQGTPYGG